MIADALARGRAGLLVIDLQARLVPAMPEAIGAQVVRQAGVLIEVARRLGLPIVVSEQYPKGLGPTVAPIATALDGAANLHRLEKLTFSATRTAAWAQLAPRLARDQWIVVGMEAHICVAQTVADLRRAGAQVVVATDAVASRSKANWRVGLDLFRAAGATPSSTEAIAFELLGEAGTDDFKAVSKLIK